MMFFCCRNVQMRRTLNLRSFTNWHKFIQYLQANHVWIHVHNYSYPLTSGTVRMCDVLTGQLIKLLNRKPKHKKKLREKKFCNSVILYWHFMEQLYPSFYVVNNFNKFCIMFPCSPQNMDLSRVKHCYLFLFSAKSGWVGGGATYSVDSSILKS